ncbi:TPA: hypothetical protein ACH3X3_007832 [Trebouxia sp. C0006]
MMQVLGGVSICFYGFGANDDPKLAQPKSLAQTFGAQCFSSRYSHIIGLRYTAKAFRLHKAVAEAARA